MVDALSFGLVLYLTIAILVPLVKVVLRLFEQFALALTIGLCLIIIYSYVARVLSLLVGRGTWLY